MASSLTIEVSGTWARLDRISGARGLLLVNNGSVPVTLDSDTAGALEIAPGEMVTACSSEFGTWGTASDVVPVLVAAGRVVESGPDPRWAELRRRRDEIEGDLSLSPRVRNFALGVFDYMDQGGET